MTPTTPQTPATGRPPTRRPLYLGLAGAALVLAVAGTAIWAAPASLDRAEPGVARPVADGLQEITVEVANGVYRPNVLRAKAGAPLRIHVVVRERHSCATKLLIPELKLDFDLPSGGEADLLLPAAGAGSYLFTCGQQMVKGSIVLE